MTDQTSDASIKKTMLLIAKPDSARDLRAALIQLQQATRLEADCHRFTFYQALSEPDEFVLLEHFADQSAFDRHMQMPHTKAFFAAELVASSLTIS
ncbi:MAG: antibiotic biosynthesis monooxygenase [Hyphomicrobiales bacterium]|nr:antibiotic biosynthesis monooxygenase [Hyphomicrobiales bacterium]